MDQGNYDIATTELTRVPKQARSQKKFDRILGEATRTASPLS